MQTIKQRWTIPEDKQIRIKISLPESIPSGEADVLMVIVPQKKYSKGKQTLMELAGSLKGSQNFSKDAVEIQRALRNEW